MLVNICVVIVILVDVFVCHKYTYLNSQYNFKLLIGVFVLFCNVSRRICASQIHASKLLVMLVDILCVLLVMLIDVPASFQL